MSQGLAFMHVCGLNEFIVALMVSLLRSEKRRMFSVDTFRQRLMAVSLAF